LIPACASLFESRGSGLKLLTSRYIQCRKFHPQVVFVYLQPFRHNSLLKCVSQTKIAKNLLKPPILGVQSRSRSSMLPVLVMISSMYVPICNHFYVIRANSGRITSFYEECPCFASLFVRTPFTR